MTSSDWPMVRLESIASFRNGVNYDKSNMGGGLKVIGVADFQDRVTIGYRSLSEINPDGVVSDEDLLKDGDILFVRSNGNKALIGRCLLLQDVSEPITFSGFTIRMRLVDERAYPPFYAYLFRSPLIRQTFWELGGGTNISNLSQKILKDLLVPLPPLPEQRKLAQILATWDQAIDSTVLLITATQKRKRGLMQQLLTGKRKLPAFEASTWTKRRLGDLFSERRETHRSDLALLSITNNEGVVPRESIERRDTSNEDKSQYLRICPGDIGYNTMRMWQGVSAVSGLEGIVSPAYTICAPRDGVDVCFMGYLFKFPPMINLFKRYSQGLVDDTLSLKFDAFAKIEVLVPEKDEQRAIATVLAACDHEISLLGQKLELFKQQKQGLMQQLLTGKVRVAA